MSQALEKLHARMNSANSLLCVGLDSDISQLPSAFQNLSAPQLEFNTSIIDQTHDLVVAYKFNLAFYESRGVAGWTELAASMKYLQTNHPEIFTIADAKRGDIGNTNEAYAQAIFDELGFDAVTLHPYLGKESLTPFLNRKDKANIILCRTSNPGAGDVQDLPVDGQPLWQVVAQKVAREWNDNHNCMLVVGATYPQEMAEVRKVVGDEIDFLVPGIGSQGGAAKDVTGGLNSQRQGLVITASRSVIFADHPRQAAQQLFDEIAQLQ